MRAPVDSVRHALKTNGAPRMRHREVRRRTGSPAVILPDLSGCWRSRAPPTARALARLRLEAVKPSRRLVDDGQALAEGEPQVGRQPLGLGREDAGRDRDDAGL